MRPLLLISSLLSAAASSAAAQTDAADVPFVRELNRRSDSLQRLKPARELKAAIARGDWHFGGVQGYAIVAPGVAFNDPFYPKDPRGIHVIEGTSDFEFGEPGKGLNRVAAEYAKKYNQLLLKLLREAGKP